MRKYLFMMVCGSLLSLAIAHSDVAADILRDHEWSNWKQKHMKYYASDNEELERYVTWRTNKAYVEYHNALAQDFGYSLVLNTFGDVGSDEFCRSKECSEVEKGPLFVNAVYLNVSERAKGAVPAAIDWRQKGIVTAVKDQGMCHGCYAFVVAGMLEGLHAITTGNLVSLSEQNIIDCSVLYGNRGCSGGDRLSAVSYVTDNGGINTEADYPYKARQGLCNFSSSAIAVSCTGIIRIQPGSEEDLMAAIAFSGPVSVSIDAAHNSFQQIQES
eukprot:Em0017g931a